jgi:arylsulfatase A
MRLRHVGTVSAVLVLFSFFVFPFSFPSAPAGQSARPNIVLIHADDLGWGDLGVYGQQKFRTPRLDRMAAEGTRFTQYYSGSTVCAPSRYALMSGFHMGHAYIRGNGDFPIRPDDVTVAEVLKTAGYSTGVIGKYGLGKEDTAGQPKLQGFDYSFGFLTHRHPHRQYTNYLFRNGERIAVDPTVYANDLMTAEALEFVDRHRTQPFFLYLAYTVPHAEIRVPDDSIAEYRGKFPETPFVNEKADAHPTDGYRSQPTPRAAFAAMITRMDRDIGRLFDRLRERGLDNRTAVFFTSDNGPHKEGGADPAFFNSSGGLRGIKRDLYEGGIRVPMIVRWPGRVPAGRVSDHVWAHWDVLPTAADMAGAAAPKEIDGLSMLPAVVGKTAKAHDFLYWEFFERGFDQAVRMGDWKAVRHGADKPIELYNLATDRNEEHDVAPKHPDVVKKIGDYLKTARTPSEIWPRKTN